MKKTIILVFIFLLLGCFVFAEDSVKTFFPSLVSEPVYPVDSAIGQTVSNDRTVYHAFLSKAITEPFDFDWCETFLAPEAKKGITTLYTAVLTNLLPAQSFILSRPYQNADNSVSISVKFTSTGEVLTFVILDNHIINISSLKK